MREVGMLRTRTAPPRERVFRMLLTEAERAMLTELALREQRTMSDVVRDALRRYRAEAMAK
jgi:hypothetical protein